MRKKLISIIVPVYNSERYLRRCIESLLRQTYKNIEIILINDGSTDNSGTICKEMGEKTSRIIYIEKENQGISITRNIGIQLAKGEWIAFVDSDDYITENYISKMYGEALKIKEGVVVCDFQEVDYDEKRISATPCCLNGIKTNKDFLKCLWKTSHTNTACVVVWNKLYHAKLLKDIRFEGRIHEDEKFLNDLYYNNFNMSYIDQKLYVYCKHPESLIRKQKSRDNLVVLQYFMERITLFKKLDLKEMIQKAEEVYLDVYIDFYNTENCSLKHELQVKYKKNFKKILFDYILKNRNRNVLRYIVFLINPSIYMFLTRK